MKVGIITIHKSPNYGASLQAYGLYSFLKSQNIECEIIDLLRPTHSEYIQSKSYLPYRKQNIGLIKRIKRYSSNILKKQSRIKTLTPIAQRKFDAFNSNIQYSKTYYSIDELYEDPPQYDIYITGSDQLWNPTIGFCIEPYFLTFVNNGGRKISYATSVGISELENHEKSDFSKWLADYYSISVREESAVSLLSPLVSQKITQVCDPSFLLVPDQWKSKMIAPTINEPYLLLFTLGYNKTLLDFCQRLSSESGKKLVYLCLYIPNTNISAEYIAVNNAGPQEFLGYIANADMVITNSFHGTVFSLILGAGNVFSHVPSTPKRGKRITDLLETYNMSNHVLGDDLTVSFQDLESRKMDKKAIDIITGKERKRSQAYLLDQLK